MYIYLSTASYALIDVSCVWTITYSKGPPFNIQGGGGSRVLIADKSFISTLRGGALKKVDFITCFCRTVLDIYDLFHPKLFISKVLQPLPPEIEWWPPMPMIAKRILSNGGQCPLADKVSVVLLFLKRMTFNYFFTWNLMTFYLRK